MLGDLLNLFYPALCLSCGNSLPGSEKHICFSCFGKIAFCPYPPGGEHPVSRLFWGRCRVDAALSLLLFTKSSPAREMLHRLKYHGEKEVGYFFGRMLGEKIAAGPVDANIDAVVPVPLSNAKRLRRGFNQSELIARGVSEITGFPVCNNLLVRASGIQSQTRKGRLLRAENVEGAFTYKTGVLPEGSAVLLVDDVVTTGATLEACISALNSRHSVSIATVAYQ